jgi:hypothetical protein
MIDLLCAMLSGILDVEDIFIARGSYYEIFEAFYTFYCVCSFYLKSPLKMEW